MVSKPKFIGAFLLEAMAPLPDLYGRGFSDAPSTTYDSVLYTTQLALLLQHLGWRTTNVVGVSMASVLSSPSSTVV